MLRLLGALALALAATTPAFAQGDDDDRGNRGQQRDDRGDRSDRDGDDDRGDRRGKVMREARELPGDFGRVRESIERADYRNGGRMQRDGEQRSARERIRAAVPGCPPGLAKRNNGCLPPGLARQGRDDVLGFDYSPALFGVPVRAVADYVLYDGFLVPSDGGSGGGLARYLPLLGGALGVGQVWPEGYPSLPLDDWQQDYFGFESPDAYRYADNVVYQVDPATSAIEAVVALLSGSDFTVGERMPDGYDVYNVPTAYQDRYADSDEAMYRYADGRVYEVDPVSMLVEKVIDLIA